MWVTKDVKGKHSGMLSHEQEVSETEGMESIRNKPVVQAVVA